MTFLVTGSSGHLGEALVRVLRDMGKDVRAIDVKPGPFTDETGTIIDTGFVENAMAGVRAVLHTATLHKPHVVTHSRQDFIATNITGTQTLLDAALRAGVESFVFTSTTSAFGDALVPPLGEPAAWITEEVAPRTKNVYGATKLAAEDLCWLAHRKDGLSTIVLRTSRFFPEEDDNAERRAQFSTENAQANEFLNRRVDISDVVSAHLLATQKANAIGFGRYIISATTPFTKEDCVHLRKNARFVIRQYADVDEIYSSLGWALPASLDRVYVNDKARTELGWQPEYDFSVVLNRVRSGKPPLSDLALAVGVKGYHDEVFQNGPFPVD